MLESRHFYQNDTGDIILQINLPPVLSETRR